MMHLKLSAYKILLFLLTTYAHDSLDTREGVDLTLKCRFTEHYDSKDFTFYWARWTCCPTQFENVAIGDVQLNSNYRLDFRPNRGIYDLQIKNTSYNRDNGRFECRIKAKGTGADVHQTFYNVTVLTPPHPPIIMPGNIAIATEDKPLQLTCSSIGGSPDPVITWYREGSAVPLQSYILKGGSKNHYTNATLQILPRRIDDGAKYKCVVWNRAMTEGHTLETTVALNVNYYPRVEVGPQNPLRVERDHVAKLDCRVDAKPMVSNVRWTRNGQYVSTTPTYTIYRVNRHHAGKYTCTAENGLGKSGEKDILVDVLYPPIIVIETKTHEAEEGETVIVHCNVTSNPLPITVEWLKEGAPNFRYTGELLTLAAVRAEHAGNYICRAVNHMQPFGSKQVEGVGNSTVALLVRHRPGQAYITPNKPVVHVGSGVTLSCSANPPGWPVPQYRWFRDMDAQLSNNQKILAQGPQYSIPKAHMGSEGRYHCHAVNELGIGRMATIKLEVHQPPQFLAKLQQHMTRRVGDAEYAVTCSAKAKPVPIIRWIKDGTEILPGRKMYIIRTTPTESSNGVVTIQSTLKFKGKGRPSENQLVPGDRGLYTCLYENEVNSANSSMHLRIEHEPIVLHQYNKVAFDMRESAEVMCKVQAYPKPEIQWQYSNNPSPLTMSSDGHYEISTRVDNNDVYTSILRINHLSHSDYGDYTCRAINPLDAIRTQIRLQPKGPPERPTALKVLETSHNFIIISWLPGFNGGILSTKFLVTYRRVVTPRDQNLLDCSSSYAFVSGSVSMQSPEWLEFDCFRDNPCKVVPLDQHQSYVFKIYALNSKGSSGYSNEVMATTNVSKIPPPLHVTYDPNSHVVGINVAATCLSLIAIVESLVNRETSLATWEIVDTIVLLPSATEGTFKETAINHIAQRAHYSKSGRGGAANHAEDITLALAENTQGPAVRVKLCLRSNHDHCGEYTNAEVGKSYLTDSSNLTTATIVAVVIASIIFISFGAFSFVMYRCRRSTATKASNAGSTVKDYDLDSGRPSIVAQSSGNQPPPPPYYPTNSLDSKTLDIHAMELTLTAIHDPEDQLHQQTQSSSLPSKSTNSSLYNTQNGYGYHITSAIGVETESYQVIPSSGHHHGLTGGAEWSALHNENKYTNSNNICGNMTSPPHDTLWHMKLNVNSPDMNTDPQIAFNNDIDRRRELLSYGEVNYIGYPLPASLSPSSHITSSVATTFSSQHTFECNDHSGTLSTTAQSSALPSSSTSIYLTAVDAGGGGGVGDGYGEPLSTASQRQQDKFIIGVEPQQQQLTQPSTKRCGTLKKSNHTNYYDQKQQQQQQQQLAKLFRIAVDFFLFICNSPFIKKQHQQQQQQQQRDIQEAFKQKVTNYGPLQYKGTVGRDDNDVQKEKKNRPYWLISCVIKWRRNTRDSGTMGNTQTPSNQINKEVSSETLNKKASIAKSRRGSRGKVFGLSNQKKPSKGLTSTTPITTITTIPSSVDSYFKKEDQQDNLQQHDFNKYYDFGEDGSDDNEADDNLTRRVRLEKMKIAAIIQSVDTDIETCNKDDEEESRRTISTILNYDRTELPANYDHDTLKDFLTSTDSLFTEPLSPQSCKTSPTEFISDHCFTPDIEINNYAAGQKVAVKNPFPHHTLSNNKSPSALNILNERIGESGERPVSGSSFISADTSSILSPITSKAIADLQRRHQADKLSQLSVTKTLYLELPPTVPQLTETETSLSVELESTHEEMAAHLGKKLSQVLSGNGCSSEGNASINGVHNPISSSSSTGTSNTVDQMTVCLARPATVIPSGDIFNIAKAKKVELPKLSSPLLTTDSLNSHAAILDCKLVPSPLTEQQTLTSLSLTKPSMTATEAQSTVIISFKSSSSATPVQSTQTHSAQHTETECILPNRNCYCTPAATTEILSLTKQTTNGLTNTSQPQDGTTALYTSVTPKNNVLNKVASFTLEKTGMLISNHNMNNGGTTSSLGTSPHLENNNSKHYVSKKLDFTFYEKFEGQMLLKWLMSSFQTHNMHNTQLREQDIEALTLQYCNNLIQVGALKQISEKNNLETFSPFQMYQWTHTEAPIASHVLTPRKLDKAAAWPYCSTPAVGSAAYSTHKSVQVGGPQSVKKLLNSSTLPEVHALINDSQSLRKQISTRVLAMDLMNDSEITVYEQEVTEGTVESSCGYESGLQEVAVQTDLLMNQEMCIKCQCNNVTKSKRHSEKEVQVYIPTKIEALPLKVDKPVDPVSKTAPPPPPPPIKYAPVPPTPPPPPPPPLLIPKTTPPPPPMPQSAPKPPPLPSPNDLTSIKSNSPPHPPAVSTLNSTTLSLESSKSTTATKPAPLPNPTEGGWFCQTNIMRKMPVNPPKPMKPLYWTRIVRPMLTSKPNKSLKKEEDEPDSTTSTTEKEMKEIWQEINETHLDNIDEFTELFSRQAVVPTKRPIEKTAARVKTLKVLDSERSRNVGIVSRSLHVDFCEIEHAIYHVDTSVVSLETLQQIISIKASDKELELIGEAAQSCIPLDYPEQFLWKISQISMSTERISCIVFQAEFEESTTQIERKLAVIVHLSHFLIDNDELKLVFSIILTLGNYMNGGNRQRGQADGFTLDILSKLKDVKSKDSHTTLLHFIVRTYIGRKRQEGVQIREIPLPVPEPSDVERAMQVDFEEIKNQISELMQKLNGHKTTTRKVILNSNEKTLEPFKSRMEEFAQNAGKVIDKLKKELEDGRNIFIEAMKFYHFTPKTGPFEECTPNQFFEYWTNFVNDFKDIWKKEITTLWNDLLKKARDTQNERRRNVKTTKIKPGGLKERIMRLNKK